MKAERNTDFDLAQAFGMDSDGQGSPRQGHGKKQWLISFFLIVASVGPKPSCAGHGFDDTQAEMKEAHLSALFFRHRGGRRHYG
jgi:hypothetical protein